MSSLEHQCASFRQLRRKGQATMESPIWISRCYCFGDCSAGVWASTKVRKNSKAQLEKPLCVKFAQLVVVVSTWLSSCPVSGISDMRGYFLRAFFGPSLSRMYNEAGTHPNGMEYLPSSAERYGSNIVTVVSLISTWFEKDFFDHFKKTQKEKPSPLPRSRPFFSLKEKLTTILKYSTNYSNKKLCRKILIQINFLSALSWNQWVVLSWISYFT